jgi:hypothetical protein
MDGKVGVKERFLPEFILSLPKGSKLLFVIAKVSLGVISDEVRDLS